MNTINKKQYIKKLKNYTISTQKLKIHLNDKILDLLDLLKKIKDLDEIFISNLDEEQLSLLLQKVIANLNKLKDLNHIVFVCNEIIDSIYQNKE